MKVLKLKDLHTQSVIFVRLKLITHMCIHFFFFCVWNELYTHTHTHTHTHIYIYKYMMMHRKSVDRNALGFNGLVIA